jgi:signal peptidase I
MLFLSKLQSQLKNSQLIGVMIGFFFLGLLFYCHQLGMKIFLVTSGSMKPALSPGSIIITRPSEVYSPGDVITYKSVFKHKPYANPQILVTHRVLKKRQTSSGDQYLTQGDANQNADVGWIEPDHILGKAVFCLPLLGYIILFLQIPLVRLLLVLVPGLILVVDQSVQIFKYLLNN